MGGWIKLEKDLLTDPRVIRMARHLCNGQPLQGVTLVLGALAHLWMIADTHIGDDDVLPLGIDEVNEVIGLPQFCQLLPVEWLQVIDAERVKLPDFHTHNGGSAKKNAMNASRVTKHRKACNAQALPDKDKDLDSKNPPLPPVLHDTLPRQIWDEWLAWRRTKRYPCDPVTLAKQLKLLAPLTTADQAATIERSMQANWQGLFPDKPKPGFAKPSAPVADPAPVWAELNARRQAMNPPFRAALPMETTESYRSALMLEEMRRHGSNGAARHDG